MIPGLPSRAGGSILVDIDSNDFGVDVFQRAGSPGYVVSVIVVVRPGITIGSIATDIPALDMSGFAAGSFGFVLNQGRIQGCGGQGGRGDLWGTGGGTQYWGGGGGGGAGTAPGSGGITDPSLPSLSGVSGTTEAGGAGVASFGAETGSATFRAREVGLPGGDAIYHGAISISVNNTDGELWGGGGGGGGAQVSGFDVGAEGGDGGDPGEAGSSSTQGGNPPIAGGAAGYAIRGTGSRTITGGGTGPNLKGPIGS